MTTTTPVRAHKRRKPTGGSTAVRQHTRRVHGVSRKEPPLFTKDDYIYAYTREDALKDGFQADVTEQAREVGITVPTTITSGVHDLCDVPPGLEGSQDYRGRLHDVLWMASMKFKARRAYLKNGGMSPAQIEDDLRIVPFEVRFQDTPRRHHTEKLWLAFNKYEGFTIMTPSEY